MYISKTVARKFRNPRTDRIIELLSAFNVTWSDQIKTLPLAQKQSLDSIIDNKNSVAHGARCNLTLLQLQDYYVQSRIVIEKIDNILL